jgi:transcriptional regulator with XRE-family HTH domain
MPQFYVLDGVKPAREKAGLSAAGLAAQTGITPRTLAAIEAKSQGARRKILLNVKHAINQAAGGASFAAEPVLASGLPAPGNTSTSKRFPKKIRVEFTKKRNRAVRKA